MKEKHSFGKLISDKLQRVPSPDVDTSWQQMKDLLDREDKRKVGGFRPGTGWKIGAVLAIVVTAGLFLFSELRDSNPVTHSGRREETRKDPSGASIARTEMKKSESVKEKGSHINEAEEVSPRHFDRREKSRENPSGSTTTKANAAKNIKTDAPPALTGVSRSARNNEELSRSTGTDAAAGPFTETSRSAGKDGSRAPLSAISSSAPNNEGIRPSAHPHSGISETRQTASIANPTLRSIEENEISTDLAIPAGDEPFTAPALSESAKKLIAKNQREADILAASKKDRKQINLADLYQPFTLKSDNDNDPYWAIGLSLNNTVATGAQTRTNYNVNAKSGTLSDYIPSPYVQYHFNKTVYLQTEINMSAPQHTPQLLLDQQTTQTTERSVYLQKLYYFNWPVSMHYSPFKNFYLAGGIQFSTFQSGVASFQDRSLQAGGATTSRVLKFKDDSLAATISPNEWRWQTGADYYIKRFTLGLRYNRAFRELLNIGTAPSTRNNAFMLSLRYNLYDGRK